MRRMAVLFFLPGLLIACKRDTTVNADILVAIDRYSLTRGEVEQIIPRGTPSADSLLLAESYIRKWVKDILVYRVAERNIGAGNDEITRLVEGYRRALLKQRYSEYLIQSRLSPQISEQDMTAYYEINKDKFKLDKNLIKGLFLKVPIDALGLDNIRRQYRSRDDASLEAIEKFSMQQAVIYEYFYDRWIDFGEVLGKIPVHIADATQYLSSHSYIDVSDSAYCYLLNIDEYVLAGNVAPYEYAAPQIREQIISKRKVDFLKNFEEELYTEAVRKGEVIFNNPKMND